MDYGVHQGLHHMPTNKNLTHHVKTPLFRIPSAINAKLFSHIAMDLITGLPKSDGHNAILTIVDHACERQSFSPVPQPSPVPA
jgi:hypothetical protein